MAEDNLPSQGFADALVEDPANPPQLQALTGYRGRSAKEGNTRLYLDPELSGWVDIPDDAILLTREVQDDYGLGKSVVWAKLDAQLEQGPQAAGGGTGADFLQGQVAQDLGGGAAAGFAARPVQPIHTQLNCPTHAPFLCLQTPPRLCPPTPQCPTHHPGICPSLPHICPSLGFTCTALPPCPHHTTNPAACPSIVDACPTRLCHTQNIQQCVPQLTSLPQLCQAATPNPGCIPGGIGDPGGPVEGGQGVQAFGAQFGNAQIQPTPTAHWVSQIVVCQPVHTPFCPIQTRPEICRPVSPWCPWTFPITGPGPGTTPQFGHAGNVFAGQGFAAQAQGGMGVEAVTQPPHCFQPGHQTPGVFVTHPPQCLQPVHQTQLCPVQTHQVFCQITHNLLQCHPSVFCPTHIVQACQPVSPWCPIGTITGPTTTPQFTPQLGHAGGGGFAPAGQGVQGGMEVAGFSQFCPATHPPLCPTQFQFVCPVPTRQCPSEAMFCPQTVFGNICVTLRNL